jgi:hypothetical protein
MPDDLVEWHTVATVKAAWSDANNLGDLSDVLALARRAVWLYVPRTTRAREVGLDADGVQIDPDVVPDLVDVRYRVAQLMHVQSLVQVRRTSPAGDTLGMDGYQARVYVFGAEVRKVLVPPVHGEVAF